MFVSEGLTFARAFVLMLVTVEGILTLSTKRNAYAAIAVMGIPLVLSGIVTTGGPLYLVMVSVPLLVSNVN
jgi:hypothetical protein